VMRTTRWSSIIAESRQWKSYRPVRGGATGICATSCSSPPRKFVAPSSVGVGQWMAASQAQQPARIGATAPHTLHGNVTA
jgi:hypothetical protein